MKIERKRHNIWGEFDKITDKRLKPPVEEFQYIYSTSKGKISLIELPNYFLDGVTLWEIYSLEGELFEDVERFNSKEAAEKRINKILGAKHKILKKSGG